MEGITPITQRKAITMDYEEYLKLEKRANMFNIIIVDVVNARALDDLKQKYLEILEEINKEVI